MPFSSYFKTSLAATFHARPFSFRFFHHSRHGGELFKLHGLGFGVVLPAFRKRLLVVPNVFGGSGAVKEKEIRRNGRIGGEDAVRQPDNRVEVELLQEFLFDPRTDAVAEEYAIRDDHAAPAAFCAAHGPAKFSHDELKEEQRGLCGLFVLRESSRGCPVLPLRRRAGLS